MASDVSFSPRSPRHAYFSPASTVDSTAALLSMPPEILEHIAFLLAQMSPFDPPTDTIALASCNKALSCTLLPANNHRLWAKLFRARFDHQAITRRFGRQNAAVWKEAFVDRTQAMTRLRRFDQQPDKVTVSELWLVYLMILEHDEKNVEQLHRQAQLKRYLDVYYKDKLLGDAMQPGYPQETPERTLVIHMQYLLTTKDQLKQEGLQEAAERFFVLKPYVFAAHRYTAYFAPWTAKAVTPQTQTLEAASDLPAPYYPMGLQSQHASHVHDFDYFGHHITLRTPPLFQAACLSFSMRADNDAEVTGGSSVSSEVISVPGHLPTLSSMPRRRQSHSSSTSASAAGRSGSSSSAASTSVNAASNSSQNLTFRLNNRFETPLATLSSTSFDFTFHRLQACASPDGHPGLDLTSLRGQFAGVWEGRFTFFDFDSYREMLGGRVRSLYEGPLRAQPQIWRIEEHVVEVSDDLPEGGRGSALTAGFEKTWDEDRMNTANSIQRAVSPDEPLDPAKRYEILLFGVGHSAWGSFVLRGRVRSWDGLFSLAKEYTPDGRGRWLYRGYACNDRDVLVGRWRDTFTPVDINGYEGTFVMQRRNIQDMSTQHSHQHQHHQQQQHV